MPAGRPSEYNFELCKEVCDRVREGESIKKVLRSKKKYPSFPTWCKWKRENPELLNQYINSIQDKSDSVLDEIDEIQLELRSGKIDPSTANVLIQTLKWKAAKFYPKMFGDNKQIDLTSQGESIAPPKIQFKDK